MRQLLRTGFWICVVMFFASCKNNAPKEAKYIPKDASLVFVLDLEQLQDKLQKGGISIDSLINRVFKQHDTSDMNAKAEFTELRQNAGIDWNGKLFAFVLQKTMPDNSMANTFSVLGSLSDAAKLEAYLKKQQDLKTKTIQKEKDYSYLLPHEGAMLAWNDKQVIMTMYNHMLKPSYDTVAMTFKRPDTANIESEMKAEVSRYFTQKASESLADVSIFTGMFKEKADGYAFTSSNSSLAALSMMPLQLPKLEELLKDNYTTSTLSFDDGKIMAKSTSHVNPLLSSVLKQYAGPTVNLSMIENYPSSSIDGFMLASFNPEIIGGLLKQLEVEGLVNNFLQKSGMTSQDIYKCLKGEIGFVVSDLGLGGIEPQMKNDERTMVKTKPWGKMLFNAPIGDKASFNKIMDTAVAHGLLTKQNGIYTASGAMAAMGLFMRADDRNFIVASDSLTYAQFIAGTNKAVISKDILDRFKGKSVAFYFDVATTLNGFIKDSTGAFNNSLLSAKETFRDAIGTVDNFEGNSIKGSFEVRMQNEKQNSLVTLTRLFTDIAVDMRLQAKKEKEMEEKLFPGGVPAIIRTN